MAAEIKLDRRATWRRLAASMRPRRMAAEIREKEAAEEVAEKASMRPRRMAAEISRAPKRMSRAARLQ